MLSICEGFSVGAPNGGRDPSAITSDFASSITAHSNTGTEITLSDNIVWAGESCAEWDTAMEAFAVGFEMIELCDLYGGSIKTIAEEIIK
ncbi:MAG: hypothetical protein LBI39_04130 [Puniceicoccales bacterium]|jgi:hypothetical protein|nr:hypothetical protein [Puniceicoccales bacterium]